MNNTVKTLSGSLTFEATKPSQYPDIYKHTPWYPDVNPSVVSSPKPDGGPARYYDFPEGAITLNDLIEFKEMDFHRGNIFKACWRYSTKEGTTTEYDERKILYSASRMLRKSIGIDGVRKELQRLLDDPQFGGTPCS